MDKEEVKHIILSNPKWVSYQITPHHGLIYFFNINDLISVQYIPSSTIEVMIIDDGDIFKDGLPNTGIRAKIFNVEKYPDFESLKYDVNSYVRELWEYLKHNS